jgi:16S rRNA (guanine(966)-N(2))-methyltransferase RsmD
MRVIAGEARGRRLRPVRGRQVRPTSDRVREALFSILAAGPGASGLAGGRALDLFAGTGALGIEALSRGAAEATFVEADGDAARTIRENLAHCRLQDRARVVVGTVVDFLAAISADEVGYDLIFIDPPYAGQHGRDCLGRLAPPLLGAEAVVIVEHAGRTELPETIGALVCRDRRRYGQTGLTFYRPAPRAGKA